MESELIKWNAAVLNRELQWFSVVIDTSISLYFGKPCKFGSVYDVLPPVHTETDAPYVRFLNHYNIKFAERVVLVLALVPHVMPQLLDKFLISNSSYNKGFTEFGGLKGTTHGGFIPTGETALFLLAANDLKNRFAFSYLFEGGHYFSAHEIIRLQPVSNGEPLLSGALQLNKEFIDQFTTGRIRKPNFSIDFPAKLIDTQLDWNDLVLPHRTLEQVEEIKAWIDHSPLLMNEWGMKKKIQAGIQVCFLWTIRNRKDADCLPAWKTLRAGCLPC